MAKCPRCKQDKPFTVLSWSYPLCPECETEYLRSHKKPIPSNQEKARIEKAHFAVLWNID